MSRIATIGFFDGVHKGHCYLFEHLQSVATERGLEPLIVTFSEHPRTALQADYVPQLLTTLDERKELLRAYGEVLVLPFADIQPLTAAEFMQVLHDQYGVSVLLMGYDHRFGSDRLKHPHEYRHIGEKCGIEVLTMSEFTDGEWHVSSTEIRSALETGNIAMANELLGRPYSLSGRVVHGNGIGRSIGFPTANIQPDSAEKIIPKTGVYAVEVSGLAVSGLAISGLAVRGICNIGTNPTIGNTQETIEVYIPDFEGDLYGQHMDIRFTRFIREEKHFDSLSELREQITRDVDSSLHPGV